MHIMNLSSFIKCRRLFVSAGNYGIHTQQLWKHVIYLIIFVILTMAATLAQSQRARVGFYTSTCPGAESIVRSKVEAHV